MARQCTESGVSPRVTDAPDSDPFIVLGHIFDQVFDGVECIGAFIKVSFRTFEAILLKDRLKLWPDIDKVAFRLKFSSDILVRKDVSGVFEFFGSTEAAFIVFGAIGASGIWCALKDDWGFCVESFWNVDGGVEFCAVPHGDHVFVFLI